MSTHTGLDAVTARMVPAGATITGTEYHLAYHYGPSVESWESEEDALTFLIEEAEKRERDERDAEGLLPMGTLTLDLCWKMTYPAGGGVEFTVSRTTYASLDEAREHLARIRKYAPLISL